MEPQGTLKWNATSRISSVLEDAYNPNYEGGTAGPAFVLARLYRETHDPQFLDAARKGARHLEALATVNGDSALLFYRSDMKDIFYLGYCSGPVGTARGFFELYQLTKEHEYLDWTERLARGITESGIPEKLTPGPLECGLASAAVMRESSTFSWDFMRPRTSPSTMAFAKRVADQTISPRHESGWQGLSLVSGLDPREALGSDSCKPGYFIGGSGVGSALLHLHTAEQKQYAPIVFPDSPFLRAKA